LCKFSLYFTPINRKGNHQEQKAYFQNIQPITYFYFRSPHHPPQRKSGNKIHCTSAKAKSMPLGVDAHQRPGQRKTFHNKFYTNRLKGKLARELGQFAFGIEKKKLK
jgi:hypothetical protein